MRPEHSDLIPKLVARYNALEEEQVVLLEQLHDLVAASGSGRKAVRFGITKPGPSDTLWDFQYPDLASRGYELVKARQVAGLIRRIIEGEVPAQKGE